MSAPPMTAEQMHWIEDQVHRAARKAARRVRNQALVAFLVLLAAIGYVQWDSARGANNAREAVVTSGTAVSVDSCNRDFKSRVEVRAVLKASKDQAKKSLDSGEITQAQYDRSVSFYNERLKGLPLPDCRTADDVLTSDPDRVPDVPVPLHP